MAALLTPPARLHPAQLCFALGAAVMATEIVSVALADDNTRAPSDVLLWLGIVLYALGVVAACVAFASGRAELRDQAKGPMSLTVAAASAVLGTRLTLAGATWAGVALLVLAVAVWLVLTIGVARSLPARLPGVGFLLTVAPEAITVLCATLAVVDRAGWLLVVGIFFALAGIGFYVVVVVRFDPRELIDGAGDQWVVMGALAIVALALASLDLGFRANGWSTWLAHGFATAAIVVWAVAIIGLPALVAAEIARPRLRFDSRRWATVFPVGMYAAMSFAVDRAQSHGAIAEFASVWTWVAVVVWATVMAAALVFTLSVVKWKR